MLHARPPQPVLQVHVAPAQVPWPSQTTPPTVGHAMDTVSQASPLNPAGQSQAPSTHVPTPAQTNPAASTGQGRPTVLPHAGPVYPAWHTHVPPTQVPTPLQGPRMPFGQSAVRAAGAAPCTGSSPLTSAYVSRAATRRPSSRTTTFVLRWTYMWRARGGRARSATRCPRRFPYCT